jgi:transcriptional regulator with XRE-family HTH domain
MRSKRQFDPLRLRELRKRQSLTQEKMAELLGVHFATVNRWENGKTAPSAMAQIRIEALLLKGSEATPSVARHRARVRSLKAGDLIQRAISGTGLTDEEVLALYGDPHNWVQDYRLGRCRWMWNGSVICAYEAAKRQLERIGT